MRHRRLNPTRAGAPLALALLSLLVLADPGRGQGAEDFEGWAADARSGIALGAGALADLAEPGPTFGAGGSYWLTPSAAVRADVDLELYDNTEPFGPLEEEGPDVRLWHSTVGALLRFTNSEAPRWSTLIGAGAGLTNFDTDSFLIPATVEPRPFEFSDTYFTTYARLRVAYEVSRRVRVYLGGRSHFIVADEEDTEVFRVASGGRIQPFGTVASFPFVLGASVGLGL